MAHFCFFFLSCVCHAFMHVCLYVPCGHLLGKGRPLGSSLWCLIVSLSLPIGILGQVWYLIVSIPDLCTLTYFYCYGYLLRLNDDPLPKTLNGRLVP